MYFPYEPEGRKHSEEFQKCAPAIKVLGRHDSQSKHENLDAKGEPAASILAPAKKNRILEASHPGADSDM